MAEDRLQYYTQAMEIDATSDKPMPKVAIVVPGDSGTGGALPVTIQGASESDGALKVILDSSNLILPVDVQARLPKTIQTHAGTVVTPNNGQNDGAWIDCDGFDKLTVRAKSGTALNWEISVQWSDDGSTATAGIDFDGSKAANNRVYRLEVAGKWARVGLINRDATSPQTLTAYAHLKS